MPEQSNRTIERTFAILDYMDALNRPVRLKDITAALDYPPSSASGVLKSLVLLGYLNYDRDTMTYTLTPRIATLGTHLGEAPWEDETITTALARLSRICGGTVGLGMQSDIYAQYISVVPGERPSPYRLRPGAIRPLTRCGLGWALLTARTDREIEMLRRRVNAKEPDPERRVSAAELTDWIGTARRQGYAFSRNVHHPGVGFIAVPLPRPLGARRAAIGVAGTVLELERDERRIAEELAATVAALETRGAVKNDFTITKMGRPN